MKNNNLKEKQKFLKKLDLKLDEKLGFIYDEYSCFLDLESLDFIWKIRIKINNDLLVILKEKIVKEARAKLFKSIKPNSFDELFW